MTARALRMRIAAVGGVFFMLLLAVLGRVVQLCVVNGPELRRLAGRQHQQRVALPPERGSIVDRNGDMLALSVESTLTWAVASARMGTPPWVRTSGVRMVSGTTSMGSVSTVSTNGITNVPPPTRRR